MKPIISFVAKTIGGLILVAFIIIAVVKLLPQPATQFQPSSPNNAYPPPGGTATPTKTSTPISYPPPGKSENPTPVPVVTLVPTVQGTMPRPTEWPTYLPWPPSKITQQPYPTQIPTIFPTPVFRAKPAGNMPAAVQRLWYAYAPDSVSSPILQVEQIDSSAQRWGKGPITVDLGLRTGFPGPSVYALFPSPDSKWIAAQLGYGETAFLYVIRLDTGKTTQILPKSTFAGFIAWKSDSQNIFVHDSNTDYKSVAEVDIETGAYQHIDFPKLDGDTPDIDAIVYSPDGSLMADALAYQPKNGGRSECLLSIGITDIKSQERKTIQEIPSACSAGNLQWSPDGHYLSWIVGKNIIDTTLHTSSSQYELWVSDRTRGDTKSIYLIGVNPSRIVSPTWSPDGKNIAFVKFDDKQMRNPDGNIILIDPVNGPQAQISHFSGLSLSSLQWSSDGKLIFCNAFNDQYGTIWAINIENGDTFPVAGPVSPESPLAIAP